MKSSIQNLQTDILNVKERLKELIAGLPEAANGVRLLSPNCGIVSSSTVAANRGILSPSYYISLDVKRALITAVERAHAETLGTLIEGVIQTGTVKMPGTTSAQKVSPEFVDALKRVWSQS